MKEGGAKAIMSAYNAINGVYANEDETLLKGILKDEWGFDGIVVSDWGGSNDHALGVRNGSHLEMPGTGNSGVKDIVRAVKEGSLPEEILDERLDELLRVIFDTKLSKEENKNFDIEAHHALARRALEESCVLLKNEDGILPLKKGADIAVIGEFAMIPRYQGAGSSLVNPVKEPETIVSVLGQKEAEYGISFTYARGYRRNKKTDQKLLDEAVNLAKSKNTAVIFAGLDEVSESEGQDRSTMKMPAAQCELIEAVCEVNPNVIVVLAAGSVVEMPWCEKVKGILHGYLWGQAGASAVLNVLTGKVCPSGKLNETYPFRYEDNPCYHYFPGRERTSEYRESLYVGYRYYDTVGKKVLFPFGFGLSYTTFEYSDLDIFKEGVSFRLKNTGKTDGAEIVQLYIGKRSEFLFRPHKELKGFRKVFLKAGEGTKVRIDFDDKTFRFYDIETKSWQTEGGEYQIFVCASVEDIRLEGAIYREGTKEFRVCRDEKAEEADEAAEEAMARRLLPHYFEGRIEEVPDEEFRILYGKDIPEEKWGGKIGMNDAVCQLYYGKSLIGKTLCAVLKMIIRRSEKKGVPNLNALFIYNMPIRGFAKMLGGAVTMDMSRALVEIANGHRVRGTGKLIRAFADRKKLY